MKKKWMAAFAAVSMTGLVTLAKAQDKVREGSFALVNGVVLSAQLLDQVIQNNRSQGVQVTAETRKLIQNELAGRAALSQEALKQGLDKSPAVKAQLDLFLQNLLAESLIAAHLEKNPIDDAAVRKDYERQVSTLKDSKEYKLRDIVVADEAQAKAVLASLRKGESFDKLAREKSLDPSKEAGGDLGWLLAEQITPVVSNVVVNLNKGAVTAAPIQAANGWHVLKLEDTRPFTPPSYDNAKAQIRQALQLKQRNEYIAQILGSARIQLAD